MARTTIAITCSLVLLSLACVTFEDENTDSSPDLISNPEGIHESQPDIAIGPGLDPSTRHELNRRLELVEDIPGDSQVPLTCNIEAFSDTTHLDSFDSASIVISFDELHWLSSTCCMHCDDPDWIQLPDPLVIEEVVFSSPFCMWTAGLAERLLVLEGGGTISMPPGVEAVIIAFENTLAGTVEDYDGATLDFSRPYNNNIEQTIAFISPCGIKNINLASSGVFHKLLLIYASSVNGSTNS